MTTNAFPIGNQLRGSGYADRAEGRRRAPLSQNMFPVAHSRNGRVETEK